MTSADAAGLVGRWFRLHGGAVVKYVERRLGDREESLDVAQQVFEIAVRNQDRIVPGRELPWLYRTAGLVIADQRRKQRRQDETAAQFAQELSDTASREDWVAAQVESASELDVVIDVVRRELTAGDREVLLLAAWEGLAGTDLAVALGCRPSTAAMRLSRARRRLAKAVERRYAAERFGRRFQPGADGTRGGSGVSRLRDRALGDQR